MSARRALSARRRYLGRRVAVGAALAALAATTLGVGSAHAATDTSPLTLAVGPNCTLSADTPQAGQNTLTDSTTPTLTSVAWAHSRVTVKPKTTVRVTVKLSDDCAGSRDVILELRNATTHQTSYLDTNYVSSTVTSTAIVDTWNADVPLYGTDAGSISISHVLVLSGFTSLVYDATSGAVISYTPQDDQVSDSDYKSLTPAKATKVAVVASTYLTADAAPEPGKVGKTLSVKATLKKIRTSAYAALASTYVSIQYKSPGSRTWHTLKKVKTSSTGVAATTYKPSKKGTYSFRAVYTGSTYVAAATSATDTVKVS
ncbi:MAG TPA: hypothetical protein VMI11_13900 [Actinomycetes bacterium]|nr:hypothetical protein [Actinomycetes bacterium]